MSDPNKIPKLELNLFTFINAHTEVEAARHMLREAPGEIADRRLARALEERDRACGFLRRSVDRIMEE